MLTGGWCHGERWLVFDTDRHPTLNIGWLVKGSLQQQQQQ